MAKKMLKKGDMECDWHNDLFALHQNHGEPEKTSKYWDEFDAAMVGVSKKYQQTDMSRMIDTFLIALAEYLSSKVSTPTMSKAELLADYLVNSRTKEESLAIIKGIESRLGVKE